MKVGCYACLLLAVVDDNMCNSATQYLELFLFGVSVVGGFARLLPVVFYDNMRNSATQWFEVCLLAPIAACESGTFGATLSGCGGIGTGIGCCERCC